MKAAPYVLLASVVWCVVEINWVAATVEQVHGLRGLFALLPWVVASVGLTGVVCAAVAAAIARAIRWRPPRAAAAIAGVALLFAAAGAYAVDATQYVRLYPGYHLIAAGVTWALTIAGAPLAGWGLALNAGSLRAWAGWIGICFAFTALTQRTGLAARHVAYERTVLTARALWVTRPLTRLTDRKRQPTRPAGAPPSAAGRPWGAARGANLLLVTIDALRVDAFRRLDLAPVRDLGAFAPHAQAPAPWTVPSVHALMTGRPPWTLDLTPATFTTGDRVVRYRGRDRDPRRVWPMPLTDRSATLAEALRAAGYRTLTCASMPFFLPEGGMVRGFDHVDLGVYRMRNRNLRGVVADLLTACGLAQVAARPERPFFLWLHYADPHEPYRRHPEAPAPTPYASEVAFVGQHVRGLLANLQRRGDLDRTVLALTADHGEEFHDHGGAFHGASLHGEVMEVPLLLAGPGVPHRRIEQPLSLVDLAPTLLDLLGVPAPSSMLGRSFAPAVRGEEFEASAAFGWADRHGRRLRAVAAGRYKLIHEERYDTWQLYDLSRDPAETVNLADRRRDVLRRLEALLLEAGAI